MDSIVELVNQYGVPIVVAVGMAYFIFYIDNIYFNMLCNPAYPVI